MKKLAVFGVVILALLQCFAMSCCVMTGNVQGAADPGECNYYIILDMDFNSYDSTLDAEENVEHGSGVSGNIVSDYYGCGCPSHSYADHPLNVLDDYVSSTIDCYYVNDSTNTATYVRFNLTSTTTPQFIFTSLQAKYPDLQGFYNVLDDVTIDPNNTIYSYTYKDVYVSAKYGQYLFWIWRAVWPECETTYDISLDANGGQATGEVIAVEEGVHQTSSVSVPQREGYKFIGYFNATSGGVQYVDSNGNVLSSADFSTKITTLYAQWTEILSYALNFNVVVTNAVLIVHIYESGNHYRSITFTQSANISVDLSKNKTYKIVFARSLLANLKVNGESNHSALQIVVGNGGMQNDTLTIAISASLQVTNRLVI